LISRVAPLPMNARFADAVTSVIPHDLILWVTQRAVA
jgi:hypothetical protein